MIFIGDLALLNAFLAIISFIPKADFNDKIGIYPVPITSVLDFYIRILSTISLLLIFYGFLKLKGWGYGMAVYYNLFTLLLSIISMSAHSQINYAGNFIPSLINLMLIYPSKRYFIKENKS